MPPQAAKSDDNAGVIVPPPLIYVGFLLLGVALNYGWPMAVVGADLSTQLRFIIVAVFGLSGLTIASAGFLQLRRAGTELRPDRPTTALVTGGIYRHSRNPLYVSLALIYVALALAADNWWALVLILPTLALIRTGVIAREEAYLERKVGDAYCDYKARVRRWL